MAYDKEWQSYDDLLGLLKARGLQVSDDEKAKEYLDRIGYYRLSGYWYGFRELSSECCPLPNTIFGRKFRKGQKEKIPLDNFRSGATFEQAVKLYVFDKKLRLLAMDALERIEVAFRVDIAHLLGEHDKFAYFNPEQFFDGFAKSLEPKTGLTKHHSWLSKQAQLINRSKEEFIRFNKAKYGLPLPIWIACEVWDFGALSTLFSGLKQDDQDLIAAKYGLSNGRTLASWLRSLNYLRNVCAHHSRLWNRNIIDQPSLPSIEDQQWTAAFQNNTHARAKPFLLFCITQQLLSQINPSSTWWVRLCDLLDNEFPNMSNIGVTLFGMGLVEGGKELF